jgi:hypothetical protein
MGLLRHLLVVLALLPAAALVGCGDSGGDATGGPQGGPEGQVAQAPPPQLQIVRPEPDSTTDEKSVSVEGIVSDDARVEVNGVAAELEGPANEEGRSRWVAEIPLELGENEITVVATLNGGETSGTVTITRKKAKKQTADKDSQGEGAPQGGPAGDSTEEAPPTDPQGNQGGSGGSQGGAGGSDDEDGDQGGPAGGGGNQGGSGGGTGGGEGNPEDDAGQGGPPAAPPPPSEPGED